MTKSQLPQQCSAVAVASGALAGAVDLPNQRIFSVAMLAEKQAQLASVVQAQGQIQMEDLSRELRAPEALIRRWLYQLARRGRFSGYVDWQTGTRKVFFHGENGQNRGTAVTTTSKRTRTSGNPCLK